MIYVKSTLKKQSSIDRIETEKTRQPKKLNRHKTEIEWFLKISNRNSVRFQFYTKTEPNRTIFTPIKKYGTVANTLQLKDH